MVEYPPAGQESRVQSVRQVEQGKGVQNGGGYKTGREKPAKIERKKFRGPE